MPALSKRLEAATTAEHVPWLMGFLRGRGHIKRSRPGTSDHLSELAFTKIANMHDPEMIAAALPLARGGAGNSILLMGLGTPRGREFALAVVADEGEPVERRVRYARGLTRSGARYHVSYVNIREGSATLEGEPRAGNAGYVTRIARIAQENASREELCLTLLGTVEQFAMGGVQTKEEHTSADLARALVVLRELHGSTRSEEIKFRIETTTRRADPRAYEELGAGPGSVISIVQRPRLDRDPKTGDRLLRFQYRVLTFLEGDDEFVPRLVLVHTDSGKTRVLPLRYRRPVRGKSNKGGTNTVVLPEGIPGGRHRMFLRVTVGGAALDGHHCEADL